MSRSAALSLGRTLQRLSSLLVDTILPTIERDYAESQNLSASAMRGRGIDLVNEAQIRQYVLDPIFQELGWKVDTIDRSLIEAPAEDKSNNAKRRFLDYHGREMQANGVTKSLLIVEAKRLAVPLPTKEADPAKAVIELVAILSELNGGDHSRLTAIWADIFLSLTDYVNRVALSSTGVPHSTALTNGNWFIVFSNPHRTLVEKRVQVEDISIFLSLADASERSNIFYDLLSYHSLCTLIPPQHTADLHKFIDSSHTTLDVCLSVEITSGVLVDVQPVFSMAMTSHVRMQNGGWIQFRNDLDAKNHLLIAHQTDRIGQCMTDLENQSNFLLAQLAKQAPINQITSAQFEKYRGESKSIPKWPSHILLEEAGKGRHILHVGTHRKPFNDNSDYDGCPYHNHGHCASTGFAVRSTAIVQQSTNPPAYFPSGSPLHCAHKTVHSIREDICPILPIEEYLCCRRCALEDRCWPTGHSHFPCISASDPSQS